MSERSGFQKFIDELRRRHVPQTAAVYLVAAWAAIEFSDVVVPNLNGPQWVVTAVIIAAIVGFPVVLVLAWIFDWGPEGLHRTADLADPGAGVRGPGAGPSTSAPWAAALAVLVVGIASALAVAAVLSGGDGGTEAEAPAAEDAAEAAGGDREGPGDVPGAPLPPPALVGPGYSDSIRQQVLRGLEGMEGLAGMATLRELGDLDSADLSGLADIARRMAREAGLQVLIRTPAEWRLGVDEPVRLAPGDTLLVEGLAQDSAGIVSVIVDGKAVEDLEVPERTLRFRATLVGTGAEGPRAVPIVVRTVDGREIRQEHQVIQGTGGAP